MMDWLKSSHYRMSPSGGNVATKRRVGARFPTSGRSLAFEPLEERRLLSVSLMSKSFEMVLDDYGRVDAVYKAVDGVRSGGTLLSGTKPYFATLGIGVGQYYPTSFSFNTGTGNMTLAYATGHSMVVHVDRGAARDYLTFTVNTLSPSMPDTITLLNFNTTLTTHANLVSGFVANSSYAIYLRPLTPATWLSSVTPLKITNVVPAHMVGVEGTKFALGGCAYGTDGSGVLAALSTVIANEGLLTSAYTGPSAIDAPINHQSYLFATDISYSNYSSWISLAQASGVEMILLTNWWQSVGHYQPSASKFPGGLDGTTGDGFYSHSLKYVTDQIRAAGLSVGLHTLAANIGTTSAGGVNDSYLTSGDTRLGKDYSWTLASSVTSSQTTVVITGQAPTGLPTSWGSRSNVLQIDNELIQYNAYSYNSSTNQTTFTVSQRGAFGSTAAAHTANGVRQVHHLIAYYGAYFVPDIESTLMTEIAANLTAIINATDAEMVYLDGAEIASNYSYGVQKSKYEIMKRIDHPVRMEASVWDSYSWTYSSVFGAWDHPAWAAKEWVDQHLAYLDPDTLLPPNLGWWAMYRSGARNDALFPDEMEYFVAKAVAHDYAMSIQNVARSPTHGRQSDFLAILQKWQAVSIDAETRAALQVPGNEFHVVTLPNGSLHLAQVQYDEHKADAATAGSMTWTVNNPYGTQYPTMRVEALYGVGSYTGTSVTLTGNQSDVSATTVTAAAGITNAGVSWAPSPNGSVPYTGYSNTSFLTLTARNASAPQTGSWVKAARVYSSTLNIGTNGAVGLWVYGDGKGEILNIELYTNTAALPAAISDHYLKVDFTGWKYFEMTFVERDVEIYGDYTWSYNYQTNWGAVWRNELVKTAIAGINIYYNNIPVGQTVTTSIALVKALPAPSISLANPTVTIGSTTITFPVTLTSGQYIEFNSMTDCKRYSKDGFLLGSITPTGTLSPLAHGANTVTFSGTAQSGYNARARVTLASYDNQSENWDSATVGNWHFEEVSGTTISDSSSYLNHGTISASVTRVAGLSGKALQFNGSNGYATVPASSSLNSLTGSFTVQTAFKYSGAGPAGKLYWTILTKNNTSPAYNDTFHLYVSSSTYHLVARVGNGSTFYDLDSGVAVNDGKFHQVALVYDDIAKTYTLYMDGQSKATQAVAANWTIARNSSPVTLGYWSNYGDYFNGIIDEVQIDSRPLGADELQWLTAAPTVESVVINDGHAQRSKVNGVAVTFSTVVTMDAGAFEVLQKGVGGGLVSVAWVAVVVNDKTVATLTFSGGFTEFNSLKDGGYQLTVRSDKVRSTATQQALDGDGDGQSGGNRVFGAQAADKFFRKFGDSDGDRDVDSVDLLRFRQAYAGAYQWYFDFESDGDTDSVDLLRFRQRYV